MMGRIIGFFKSPAGAGVLFLVGMFVFFYFVRQYRERKAAEVASSERVNVLGQMSPEDAPHDPSQPLTSQWVDQGKLQRFDVPHEQADPQAPLPTPTAQPNQRPALPPLVHVFREAPDEPNETTERSAPRVFAPTGMLIPCQLVITVDSSALDTPVVGIVTDDVWHNQNLIVPAGTEVHGFAKRGRVRDRIAVTGTWTFVWQDGKEGRINGIALDRDYDPDDDSFTITDGSAGIRGTVEKTDQYLEFKMFAASALAGMTQNAKKTTKTVFGEYENNGIHNAVLDGGEEVAERYARLMLDQIEGDGLFVRVPAGTEFYIYTLQVFEPRLASVAGLRQGQRPINSWQTNQTETPTTQSTPSPSRQRVMREALEERAEMERLLNES